jgi:hypothetical protein
MKWLLLTVLLILNIISNAQKPWREGEMQVRIYATDRTELEYIRQASLNVDFCDGFIRAYLIPEELAKLNASGIRTETEIGNLNEWSASFGPAGVPNGYYTVAQLDQIADSLSDNFPDICTMHSIGIGSGFNVIYALKISDNSAEDEDEPEILFDGGIHGDEVGGPENMIRFARDLCLQYNYDPYITDLVNNREIWIIYCLNPYGRNNMTRYNQAGIDINRDCGYMWNGEGNSPAAFSQPETKALRKVLSENQFAIHCSYHSGTEFISFPWSYREDLTPDHAQHNFLAGLYASTSGYTNIPFGPGYTGMYAINGSTKDFGYGAMGAISWSVEISLSKQPPAAQIVPYYLKNKPAMLAMTEYTGYGIRGMVTDADSGQPVAATIFINDFFPVSNDPIFGDFHKFLIPGVYQVKIAANGYEPQVISGVVVNEQESTEISIALHPLAKQFATRIISSQIPNNNPLDEGFTHAAVGPPDSIQYSTGRFGWAVYDMGTPVVDGEGNDVIVHENDATPEGFQFYAGVSMDGPWVPLGTGNGTTGFNLANAALSEARYFKITDDGDGQSQVNNAGFDLDAIEGIIRMPQPDSTGWISGIVFSPLDGEPLQGATVYTGSQSTLTGPEGGFTILADTGQLVIICAEYPAQFLFDCDSVIVNPGDTTIHDIYLQLMENTSLRKAENYFILSPNPARENTLISFGEAVKSAELIISDLSGRVLLQDHIPAGNVYMLDLTGFNSGLYFLNVDFRDGTRKSQKLLVL